MPHAITGFKAGPHSTASNFNQHIYILEHEGSLNPLLSATNLEAMLAAPSSFLHRNPNPPPPNPTKSARTCRPSPTIPTKFRRQSLPNRAADLGRWTALRLDAQQQRGRTKQKPQEQEQEQHLSGADVLRALQRASAQKIKKNRTRGRETVAEKVSRGAEAEKEKKALM
nr:hypothetical protein Iba_chr01dCG17920 [Ipomoea batatas]